MQYSSKTSDKEANQEKLVPDSLRQFDSLPNSAHVQVRTVAAVIGVSEATIWRMVRRGQLPAPKKLSERASRWNVGALRTAIATA